VGEKIALLAESLLTLELWADEWSLSRVKALVNLETASSGVLFVAAFEEADEGLHARVRQLMRLQVTLGDELLAALPASEGSLTRVRPHVSLEVARLLELLQTALERTNQELNFIFWPFDSLD